MTAFVRDPGRLAARGPRLRVVAGSVTDPSAVRDALSGSEAVLSALGPRTRRDAGIASAATEVVASAMAAGGVRRIAVVSAAPLGNAASGERWVTRRVVTPLLWAVLRATYEDLRRMEDILIRSLLEWTVVRPPRLTDGSRTGRYRTEVGGQPLHGTRISRADVADALLASLDDPRLVRRAVGVAD